MNVLNRCAVLAAVFMFLLVAARSNRAEEPPAGAGEAPPVDEALAGAVEERPIVLDHPIRVEAAGLELMMDSGWSFRKHTAGLSRLDGRGPNVYGLEVALSVWHMESAMNLKDFAKLLKEYLVEKGRGGVSVVKEPAGTTVSGRDAVRFDLTGRINSDDGQISIKVIYSYVVVNREIEGKALAKTIVGLIWPVEDNEYYEKYWNELLKTCNFYGPGFARDDRGRVDFVGYSFQCPEGWEVDIENDEARDQPTRKEAFRINLSAPLSNHKLRIRAILYNEIITPEAYAEKKKTSFEEKGIKNLNLEQLAPKTRFRLTFPYTHEGRPYIMAVFVAGDIGAILEANTYIKEEEFQVLSPAFNALCNTLVPPGLAVPEAK
ncbi:MAG TPA: hypothetical protein ENN09_04535 [Planctomycetes bacterium]|nr:hypothetical protein [Planctomycetota bacterium]